MNGEPSVHEITRRLQRLEDTTVHKDVLQTRHEAIEDRLKRLEDAQTWAYRFIIVLVLSTIGNLVISLIQGNP